MIKGDTIAAIATAPGRGGVAVVRVSGPEALTIAEKVTSASGRMVGWSDGRMTNLLTARHALFYDLSSEHRSIGASDQRAGEPTDHVIDDGILLAFRAPHSYTGEDVVEFQCHGGAVTPRRVLEACFAAGARLARRGEFTERAFLNGKLDYDQAESVLDLIDAKTVRAADAALEGLAGRKRRELKALYQTALDLSAQLEHALDVDEGELPVRFADDVASRVSSLASSLGEAIRRVREGKILRQGALVVLAGPPNAGKSSLLNALLEENRAIVSDVPGTTRDSIEEWMDLGGWPIRLVDTAGLRESADEIEGAGVKRSEELIAKADLVLWLGSTAQAAEQRVSRGLGEGESNNSNNRTIEQSEQPNNRTIPLHPKCDLGRGPGLNVSSKTGEGLDELKRAIVAKLEEKAGKGDEGDVLSADETALHQALAMLEAAPSRGRETGDGGREEDLVLLANAVRSVAERLGESVGAVYSSDLLDNLFSRFCVGK